MVKHKYDKLNIRDKNIYIMVRQNSAQEAFWEKDINHV